MEILAFFLGILFGGTGAAIFIYPEIKKYRDRWQGAMKLLEGGEEPQEKIVLVKDTTNPSPPRLSQTQLYRMKSWDRRDMEIDRANNGLPPRDDLRGMKSWDIADVENARTRAERKKNNELFRRR